MIPSFFQNRNFGHSLPTKYIAGQALLGYLILQSGNLMNYSICDLSYAFFTRMRQLLFTLDTIDIFIIQIFI